MKKQTLTVATENGTLTRTTARAYAFVVAARGERLDYIAARRAAEGAQLAAWEKEYAAVAEGRKAPLGSLSREEYINDFLPNIRETIANHDANFDGRIERANAEAAAPYVSTSGVWSSRLDLARKEAAKLAEIYRDVRIFSVADGAEVR